MYLINDLHPEYVKTNAYNSIIRRQKPNLKWAKDFNKYFTKEDVQMVTTKIKSHSTSLTTLENNTISSYKFKHTYYESAIPFLGMYSRYENICSHKDFYVNVQCSITHNSPSLETIPMSIHKGIDKTIYVIFI